MRRRRQINKGAHAASLGSRHADNLAGIVDIVRLGISPQTAHRNKIHRCRAVSGGEAAIRGSRRRRGRTIHSHADTVAVHRQHVCAGSILRKQWQPVLHRTGPDSRTGRIGPAAQAEVVNHPILEGDITPVVNIVNHRGHPEAGLVDRFVQQRHPLGSIPPTQAAFILVFRKQLPEPPVAGNAFGSASQIRWRPVKGIIRVIGQK